MAFALHRMTIRGGLHPPAPEADETPDGGYGWVCVGTCFTINCFTWGVVAPYGVYLNNYLSTDLYPDVTAINFAVIGGFNFSMAMLVAPFATIIARKLGTQLCIAFGAVLLAAGFISASFTSQVWQLYLSQGVLVGFGVGFTYVPSVAILSQWFHKKRSLANGISAAGSGVGGLIFSFATEAMISNISLAWSLRITGVVCGIMNLTAAVFIRNRNEIINPPQRAFDTKLLFRYDVTLLLAWAFISMLGYITILFSLSDFARSIGLSDTEAASISAFLNLGTAVGRPFIGIISDHYGRMETAGTLTFVCGITCFALWLPATSYGLTTFFAIINGAILGVFWVVSFQCMPQPLDGNRKQPVDTSSKTIRPICVEVAGLAQMPSLLSLSWVSIILPTTFSEIIALKIRRVGTGREYVYAQIFAGSAYVVASGCMYELRRFSRQQKQQSCG